MRFINTILDTLGIGIGTFLTFVFVAIIGFIIIANYEFFLSLLRGLGDWIVVQLSRWPVFANGIYASMIKKAKLAKKEARDLQSELEGQRQELLNDYYKNQDEYKKCLERASYLKSQNRSDEALSYAKKAVRLQEENKKIMEIDVPNLDSAIKAAEHKITRLTEEIDRLKHDRKADNKTRKTLKVLEKSDYLLMGDNTETDEQILENYRDHLNSRRVKAQGREAILAKSPKEKLRTLDDEILLQEAQKFLETL